MSEELKPCPFCGAKAKLHHEGRAYCRDCGIENMFLTVDKWNSRPIENALQSDVVFYKKMFNHIKEAMDLIASYLNITSDDE